MAVMHEKVSTGDEKEDRRTAAKQRALCPVGHRQALIERR